MEISQDRTSAASLPALSLPVVQLAEAVHRSGGLSPDISGSNAVDGIRLHRVYCEALQNKYGAERLLTEISLSVTNQFDERLLTVSGRCDAVILSAENQPDDHLLEIKTHNLPEHRLPAAGDPLHWAQLKLYGHLFLARHTDRDAVVLELVYLQIRDRSRVVKQKRMVRADLAEFFMQSCRCWLARYDSSLGWIKIRDESAKRCRFPYEDLRSGQKSMMRSVLQTIRSRSSLLAQAPTGTGKTMAVLYPAVKALGHHLIDYVFYLTAMTSTRQTAVQGLRDMREAGLHIRSVVLYAKESLCLQPQVYCDTAACDYACHYYDHLPDALRFLMRNEEITKQDLLACAGHYRLCPFELSLDIALYCDFIICDYNYAFDPRVKLDRFFGESPRNSLLLVDEAHNLPDRAREMYSAGFSEQDIQRAIERLNAAGTASDSPENEPEPIDISVKPLLYSLRQVAEWFERLRPQLGSSHTEAGFEAAEKSVASIKTMKADGFIGMRDRPSTLLSYVQKTIHSIRQFMDTHMDPHTDLFWRDLIFKLSFFIRVADLYDHGCHITSVQIDDIESKSLICQLLCLDASVFLIKTYHQRNPAVFFSATLTPMRYYTSLLNSQSDTHPSDTISLSSPFPSENLLIMSFSGLSARYRDRNRTMDAMLDLILAAADQHTGNYLVFVPSFAYLHMFRSMLARKRSDTMDCMLQIPGMDDVQKQQFLDRFNQYGSRTLLAIAVLGSLFNEGINLVGEKLSGVMIIGAGLPQITPQREVLRQYYDDKFGSGYAYSYIYPGFNKIQQAAGRLIRSENDRGFVLLLDDRFDRYEYQQLFPLEWHVKSCGDLQEVTGYLSEFWQDK